MGVNLFSLSPSKYAVAAVKGDKKRCSSCVEFVFCKKICKYRNATIDEVISDRRIKNGKNK
ncbi:MAG: hypothetical protein IKY90_08935 [Oscillospiraceae bacterium]|nr:hypothetical protein [Oscillospiraceae bacterium]